MTTRERPRIERYDAASIEPRWQAHWAELGLYEADLEDTSRPKYYLLTMYPYPSGDLHIGHWYITTPTDALARFRRMHGDNVFYPIGFDAFGLPAEGAAIKNGIHPAIWTMQNIEIMRRQFRSMGATFQWSAEVVTALPEFYRWNQWIFLKLLEAGLAYRAMAPVDWCPNDGTLAREQVEGPERRCWRCGALVEKRDLEQWFSGIHRPRLSGAVRGVLHAQHRQQSGHHQDHRMRDRRPRHRARAQAGTAGAQDRQESRHRRLRSGGPRLRAAARPRRA